MENRMKLFGTVCGALLFSATMARAFDINVPVHFDTLQNGLRIIVVPDANVAVVSCRLYYFVGSMYEHPGTTGLSHMFEHMMFKGTKRIGSTEFQQRIGMACENRLGGQNNLHA